MHNYFAAMMIGVGVGLLIGYILERLKPLPPTSRQTTIDPGGPLFETPADFGDWLRRNGLRASEGAPPIERQWQDFTTYDGRPK